MKLLQHKSKRTGVLVPLIEDFMLKPVNIETEDDVKFLTGLFSVMAEREQRRNKTPMFSPSSLASCLRQVYLLKHHKQLGIEKSVPLRREPNFYFLHGNFLHVKWQFVLYKMEKAINDPQVFEILGLEVPIQSKRGDHGGTADVVASVYAEPYVIDLKGLNVRTFGEITRGQNPPSYEVQLADYMVLWNSQRGINAPAFKINKALLLSENKGGPDSKHPIALHESVIDLEDFKPEVKKRLDTLREYEAQKEIPPPECTSTGTFQFSGCPFAKFCKKEVQAIQYERRIADAERPAQVKVARPPRNGRKRRVAKT